MQVLQRLDPGQRRADVVGDELQHLLIAEVVDHVLFIALHRQHAQKIGATVQGHAQPTLGPGQIGAGFGLPVLLRIGVDQQGPATVQHLLDKALARTMRLQRRRVLVGAIGETDAILGLIVQGHQAIARRHHFRQQPMQTAEEGFQRQAGIGQFGNAEQGALEALGALALGHLGAQPRIGPLQLAGAQPHLTLQLTAMQHSLQHETDMAGGEQEQLLLGRGQLRLVLVQLQHHRADHMAAGVEQRRAHPAGRQQPLPAQPLLLTHFQQALAAQHHRLAAAYQPGGQRRRLAGQWEHGIAGGRGGIALIDIEREMNDLGFIVIQGDVEIAGVHQPHHLPVQAGQHLIDGAALLGQLRDVEQGVVGRARGRLFRAQTRAQQMGAQ